MRQWHVLKFGGRPRTARRPHGIRAGLPLLAIFTLALAGASAQSQEFYAGKTITIIIGNAAGSAYDAYGRLIGRYMAKYLPGNPAVVAQDMPGAGGARAADYLYNIAPKDGTAIALVVPGALIDPLTADPSAFRHDPTKFEFLGTADSGTRLCFSAAGSKIKTFEDAQKIKSVTAGTAASTSTFWINRIAKASFQAVNGYTGPGEMFLALERGEADAICALDLNAVNSLRPGWVGSAKINLLAQIGMRPKPELSALGVPEIWKFIAPEDRALVELLISDQTAQRPMIAPPGTPSARVQALRAAFDVALGDPELLAEAKKANLEINPLPGGAVAAHIAGVFASPIELRNRMREILKPTN